MAKIAIEATGCDGGFSTVLDGAKRVVGKNESLELILVAGKDKLPERYLLLDKIPFLKGKVALEKTDYTYDFNDKNKQKRSSIYRALEMHKAGEVDAVIAPGETVGTIIYSSKILRRIPKILRPVLPANLPNKSVLVDVGANPECKPEHFFQFAIMGKVYSQNYLGVKDPLISVLNIGEEDYKGPGFVKEGMKLIKSLGGKGYNISEKYFEGTSLEDLEGGLVIITNGYAGNIALKVAEVSLKLPYKVLIEEIENQRPLFKWISYAGLFIAKLAMHKPLQKIIQKFDYKKHAVVPLLGINGSVMVCHGRSDAETMANAIKMTEDYLRYDINSKLEEEIARCG